MEAIPAAQTGAADTVAVLYGAWLGATAVCVVLTIAWAFWRKMRRHHGTD